MRCIETCVNQIDEHVPGVEQYDPTYMSHGRAYSFAAQLDAVLSVSPMSVLEVGVGTGICALAMRRLGFTVTTLDVQAALSPDILGDVRAIPREAQSFEVSSCCQVLEHLPFDQFVPAVRELHRVTRTRLVLSLPDTTRGFECALVLPRIGLKRFSCVIPTRAPNAAWRAERLETMGHYWEIGVDGISARTIVRALRAVGFASIQTFRVRELQWHRFFVADLAPTSR